MIHCLVAMGTRPEAIKLAPVIRSLKALSETFVVTVCNTGQHRDMVDGVVALFDLHVDEDLHVMSANQSPTDVLRAVIGGADALLNRHQPDLVLVQGDTTSAVAVGLACSYAGTPLGHVEAGLRTHDLRNPFPEEINRQILGRIARWHFAPTQLAEQNLLREGVDGSSIWVTGNTGIDALLEISGGWPKKPTLALMEQIRSYAWGASNSEIAGVLPEGLVLVTMHRRESFGPSMKGALMAVKRLALDFPNVHFVFPVHPNPNVRSAIAEVMRDGNPDVANLLLTDPLDYETFVRSLVASDLILTDSGGVQEEGPTMGVPVLVLREKTERQEALGAGFVKLVGTESDQITAAATRILSSPKRLREHTVESRAFGDGLAATRIAEILAASSAASRASRR